MTVTADAVRAPLSGGGRVAVLGDRSARLLAGPPAPVGAEPYGDHLKRLGIAPTMDVDELVALAAHAGLCGRGGGDFPLATRLQTAAAAADRGGRRPLVVVNGAEGEPASRKDRVLLETRPHLVLDGAEVAAAALDADVVVYAESASTAWSSLENAVGERRFSHRSVHLVDAPKRYVAGESSAVVATLEGRGPVPGRRSLPVAARGVGGRPTVVSNTETLGHLALAARFGASWFVAGGPEAIPGSTLLTLAGAVARPGQVVEAVGTPTFGDVLRDHGGLLAPPGAVLLGGYAGHWVGGASAWDSNVDRGALRRAGMGLGCGVVAVLPHGACGLAVTAELVGYLAGQSAGQCGPCVFGLAALAEEMRSLADGRASARDLRRLPRTAGAVRGGGDCSHPDGVAGLVESALAVFADDARRHVRTGPCRAAHPGWFPIPRGQR